MGAPRVVFDGTRQAPWVNGPYLAVAYDPPRPAPAPAPRLDKSTVRQAVLAELQDGPRTLRALVDATAVSMDAVNTALYDLQRWGVVVKVGVAESRQPWGRGGVHLYGLAPDEDG